MGLITYPRLNLRCEGTQEGTQGGLHKLLHLSVSDLSFWQEARSLFQLPKCSFKQWGFSGRKRQKLVLPQHCQDEGGSEFKRLQETHHSVTTQLETYRPNRTYKVDISTVHYMDESASGMNSWMHCMNLTKATTGYARTLKSNKGYYKHRLVAKMIQGWKDCKAGML